MICSANSVPILSCASKVAAPICGVNEIFGCIKILISGVGSFSKTSKPANNTLSSSKASTKATSSITPPRAQLIIPTFYFIICNSSLPITYPSWAGTCNVIKSECLITSSKDSVTISTLINCPL